MAFLIKEVIEQEYLDYSFRNNTIFDSVQFNKLNAHKCKKILYLLFMDDKKTRFGLIGGILENGVFKAPFSSPFSWLLDVKENKMIDYQMAIKSLIDHLKLKKEITGIYITLPPGFYAESHIANLQNALYNNDFKLDKFDVNYHYNMYQFTDNYCNDIDIKARQKLKASLKMNLSFQKIEEEIDIINAYSIIKANREAKGYPLHMSLEDVLKTIKIVPADVFIVKNADEFCIASAFIFNVTTNIVLVVYWGNLPGTEYLKPMNYLAYKIFEYYKLHNKKIVDIGPSTENSIPNYGLCDFKQGIGCDTSIKMSFCLKF